MAAALNANGDECSCGSLDDRRVALADVVAVVDVVDIVVVVVAAVAVVVVFDRNPLFLRGEVPRACHDDNAPTVLVFSTSTPINIQTLFFFVLT
jgi:hypothetical protein